MLTKDNRLYLSISTVIIAKAKKISDVVEEEDGIEFQHTTARASDREVRNVDSTIETIPRKCQPSIQESIDSHSDT